MYFKFHQWNGLNGYFRQEYTVMIEKDVFHHFSMNDVGYIIKVFNNTKQWNEMETEIQFLDFLEFQHEKQGIESSLLLVINNTSWHQTAISRISKGFGYISPMQ